MENANLIKRFRETYTELSANMSDDQVLHWLEHHDEEYEFLLINDGVLSQHQEAVKDEGALSSRRSVQT